MGRNSTKSANRPVATANSFLSNLFNGKTSQKFDTILSELENSKVYTFKPTIKPDELNNKEKEQFKKYVFNNLDSVPLNVDNIDYIAEYMPEKTKMAMQYITYDSDDFWDSYRYDWGGGIYGSTYKENGKYVNDAKDNLLFTLENVQKKYPLSMGYSWKYSDLYNEPLRDEFTLTTKKYDKSQRMELFKKAIEEIEKNGSQDKYGENFWFDYKKKNNLYYAYELPEGVIPE